ncbi:unnamed protein product [Arctia plantaginis]|uniref:Uncharacterized protein n=1 Tax=Arctia plantaginis TaxID=874455 RepID=A0A8S1B0X3_ARCPL|nr:unnamed protein product [Arctia plantaginis]
MEPIQRLPTRYYLRIDYHPTILLCGNDIRLAKSERCPYPWFPNHGPSCSCHPRTHDVSYLVVAENTSAVRSVALLDAMGSRFPNRTACAAVQLQTFAPAPTRVSGPLDGSAFIWQCTNCT